MADQGSLETSDSRGFVAYERDTVDRFFAEARRERARLLAEMATARRRIADASAALDARTASERPAIHAVLDGQRRLREERRANDRAITAIRADADARAFETVRKAQAHPDGWHLEGQAIS